MSSFFDAHNNCWDVTLDGLLLDEVNEKTGVDLADLSAGGLAEIEQDVKKLVRVLLVICSDDIGKRGFKPRQFSQAISGQAIVDASEAIVSAAANFFPQSQWSEMLSRLEEQRTFNRDWSKMRPLMNKLHQPDMPAAMRDAVMSAITDKMQAMTAATEDTTSEPSEGSPSATGPDATPPTPATSSQENAEYAPTA